MRAKALAILRKFGPFVLIGCLAFAAGVKFGPRPTEVHEKIAAKAVDLTATKDVTKDAAKTAETHKADTVAAMDQTEITKRTFRPDGSVASETKIKRNKVASSTHVEASKAIETSHEVIHEKIVYVDREKLVERLTINTVKPEWIVGGELGTGVPGFRNGETRLTAGVSGEKLIFWSIYAGAYFRASVDPSAVITKPRFEAGLRLSKAF